MKRKLFLFLLTVSVSIVNCQTLKFKIQSQLITKEDKKEKDVLIPFSLENATRDCQVFFSVVEERSSATIDKDYSITTRSPIRLDSANKYSSCIELKIKPDSFVESTENIQLKLTYTDEKNKENVVQYSVLIQDLNNEDREKALFTQQEKDKIENVSIDLFIGGSFDFYNTLKIPYIGGELIVHAEDISGKNNRWGFYTGTFNFHNFTYDSSNVHVREQNIRIDTGTYINGETEYISNRFVDHRKISTNQWGYYFNPTFRLNNIESNFFNIYTSFHLEVLSLSTTTEFTTDTLNFGDTVNNALGNNPLFQSGKELLPQKYTTLNTKGYLGIAFPISLNAKDKLKFHFEPGVGLAIFTSFSYPIDANGLRLGRVANYEYKPYYLFRFRASEQYTGLNITIGGEIRGLFSKYYPNSINVYLGLKTDFLKWFKKE